MAEPSSRAPPGGAETKSSLAKRRVTLARTSTLPRGFGLPNPLLTEPPSPGGLGATPTSAAKRMSLSGTPNSARSGAVAPRTSTAGTASPRSSSPAPPTMSPASAGVSPTPALTPRSALPSASPPSSAATIRARRASMMERSKTMDPAAMAAAVAANNAAGRDTFTSPLARTRKSLAPRTGLLGDTLGANTGSSSARKASIHDRGISSISLSLGGDVNERDDEPTEEPRTPNSATPMFERSRTQTPTGSTPTFTPSMRPRSLSSVASPSAGPQSPDPAQPELSSAFKKGSIQHAQQQQYASTPTGGAIVPFNLSNFTSANATASNGESENINVVVRCRPFIRGGVAKKAVTLTSDTVTAPWKGENKTFTFDRVFGDDATQRDVYQQCAGALIAQACEGYNATIMAYGQTGSGKTHSMLGDLAQGSDQNGIVPSAVDHIFAYIASQTQTPEATEDGTAPLELGQNKFIVSLSLLEIYNEQVHDLLSFSGATVSLDVREDVASGSFHVPNLSKHVVANRTELIQLIQRGNANRKTTATLMNEYSSRSHSMLTIHIEKAFINPRALARDDQEEDKIKVISSKINLIDLAGSERLTTSGKDTTGKETMAINLSLSTLANVIAALASGNEKAFVPYRDSKLTRLLKSSLGGNSKTLLVACCRSEMDTLPETVSTLRYAWRAKQIQNKARINEDPKEAMMRLLHAEIERLKAESADLKEKLIEKNKLALRMFHLVNDLQGALPDPADLNDSNTPPPPWMLAPGGTELVAMDGTVGASATISQQTTTTMTVTAVRTTNTVTTITAAVSPPLTSVSPPPDAVSARPALSIKQPSLTPPSPSPSSPLTGGANVQPLMLSAPSTPSAGTATSSPSSASSSPAKRTRARRSAVPPSIGSALESLQTPPRISVPAVASGSPAVMDLESSESLLANPFEHPLLAKILHSPSASISLSYQQAKALQQQEELANDGPMGQAAFLAALDQNAPSTQTQSRTRTSDLPLLIAAGDDADVGGVVTTIAPGSSSSQVLSSLSAQGTFYVSFKSNVLNLHTGLIDCQAKLAHKSDQHARALEHIAHLEAVLAQVRLTPEQSLVEASEETDVVGLEGLIKSSSSSSLGQDSLNASVIEEGSTMTKPAPLMLRSRRASVTLLDAITLKSISALNSPRGTNGSQTPAIQSEFSMEAHKAETQRFLQLQSSMEALRIQLEEKEDEATALRATHAKERAEEAARARLAIEQAQSLAHAQDRRVEELEFELEKQSVSEARNLHKLQLDANRREATALEELRVEQEATIERTVAVQRAELQTRIDELEQTTLTTISAHREERALLQARLDELEEARTQLQQRIGDMETEHAATLNELASASSHHTVSNEKTERWLQQAVELQNQIVQLSQENVDLRTSKRELVKNSSQELKRMRFELLQLKGIPVPGERDEEIAPREPGSPLRPTGHSGMGLRSGKDKSCAIQ